MVLATDIIHSKLQKLRKNRWEEGTISRDAHEEKA